MLRSVLLHRKLEQTKWRQVLPELVFALNCSESSAIKCAPYNVVFGRSPVLPLDVDFGTSRREQGDEMMTPREYLDEVGWSLNDVFDQVVDHLKLSKIKMQKQYNRKLRFIDYKEGEKVWLKVKHYKTGENRKLSPRRTGPWSIMSKLPNGVNFKIVNDKSHEEKVVHHDRITPVKGDQASTPIEPSVPLLPSSTESNDSDNESSEYDTDSSDYEPDSSDESSADSEPEAGHRYPQRERRQRVIPGTVPWSEVRL